MGPGSPAAVRAVIFDMDGVLADTERLHATIEEAILGSAGIALTATEISARYGGLADPDFFAAAFRDGGIAGDIPAAIAEKWRRMASIAAGEIRPMPGAVALVRSLSADGILLGLASSSPRPFIDRVLAALGLAGAFRAVASGDEVRRGKPAPEIFLLTASRLGVSPPECVVIEDSVSGIRAARAAGMACVALVGDPARRQVPADLVVRHLSELGPGTLRSLSLRVDGTAVASRTTAEEGPPCGSG